MDQFNTQIVINSTGWNKWLTPVILYSACKMDVKYFPFDVQVENSLKYIFHKYLFAITSVNKRNKITPGEEDSLCDGEYSSYL